MSRGIPISGNITSRHQPFVLTSLICAILSFANISTTICQLRLMLVSQTAKNILDLSGFIIRGKSSTFLPFITKTNRSWVLVKCVRRRWTLQVWVRAILVVWSVPRYHSCNTHRHLVTHELFCYVGILQSKSCTERIRSFTHRRKRWRLPLS